MSSELSPKQTKICPTCGTRLSENATRCLVCGTELTPSTEAKAQQKAVQASRMPEITLSLPAALGFLALFLTVGAVLVFFALRSTGRVVEPTSVPTATATLTITPTPTEASTSTPLPTATLQPPFDYTVVAGDTCSSIALTFNISVQSLIILNNLSAACNNLYIGQVLKVPYPTPTVTPQATSTLEPADATTQACEKAFYTVQDNDTLSSIAANYAVPMDAIKAYNNLPTDNVPLGMTLTIPLCQRAATPGPTPTPTIPPPYPGPNLLLPSDGASFTLANDTVTLQWASIGTLRDNESYQVTIEDVTDGQGRKLVGYVTDTKFIVPTSFRPNDNIPHVFRWFVQTVRQTGTDEQGQPIYSSAGDPSDQRVFSWTGVASSGTKAP
jgi:LysM repeat protein/ribosomal protein L40E